MMFAASSPARARLTFGQIVNMNIGFFGMQYSFGLQQGNMSPIYRYLGAAGLVNGQIGGFYNFIAFGGAFAMVPFTKRFGPQVVPAFCLTLAGIAMLSIPAITDRTLLFLPMIGIGLAWASIMGNPYCMLAGSIPQERVGVYMGIFNMFIVIPMMIQIFTLPLYYNSLLGGNPANVIRLAGALLLCAAVAVLFVKTVKRGALDDVVLPIAVGH